MSVKERRAVRVELGERVWQGLQEENVTRPFQSRYNAVWLRAFAARTPDEPGGTDGD